MAYLSDNKSISELLYDEIHVESNASTNNNNSKKNTINTTTTNTTTKNKSVDKMTDSKCLFLVDDMHEEMSCVNRPPCVQVRMNEPHKNPLKSNT